MNKDCLYCNHDLPYKKTKEENQKIFDWHLRGHIDIPEEIEEIEGLEVMYNKTAERMKKQLEKDLGNLRISAISRGADVNKLTF